MATKTGWAFVWNQESTKRGILRVINGISALVGLRFGPDVAAGVLAIGEGILGLLGAFRSD